MTNASVILYFSLSKNYRLYKSVATGRMFYKLQLMGLCALDCVLYIKFCGTYVTIITKRQN